MKAKVLMRHLLNGELLYDKKSEQLVKIDDDGDLAYYCITDNDWYYYDGTMNASSGDQEWILAKELDGVSE